MADFTLLGVDIAKSSFALYGVDNGKKTIEKTMTREKFILFCATMPKCTIVMEACGGSNFLGRKLISFGHDVKLLPPQKVKPFRKNNKNDRNDAMAITRAAGCPEIEFVSVKAEWQQDIQSLHRIRERSIKAQTTLVNEMRGLLMEYGITIPQGINHVRSSVPALFRDLDNGLSSVIRTAMADMHAELLNLTDNIERLDKELKNIFKNNETCQRIGQVEGIGVITATAIIAACNDPNLFKNGRQFAAWLGLTPGHTQTGGKDSKPIMLGITKKGNPYIRKLLVQGGMTIVKTVKKIPLDKNSESPKVEPENTGKEKELDKQKLGTEPCRKRKKLSVSASKPKLVDSNPSRIHWVQRLLAEKCAQKAAVAVANKNARIIWALLKTGQNYIPQKGS